MAHQSSDRAVGVTGGATGGATGERAPFAFPGFRALVENATDLIACSDADGVLTYLSPAAERLLGYAPEYGIGRHGFGFVHVLDRDLAAAAFARTLLRPGVNEPFEIRVVHADGGIRHLELVANNRLHDPTVGAVVFNIHDVTERHATRVQARRLQALVDNLGRGAILLSERDDVVLANPMFCEMFGIDESPDALVGLAAPDVFARMERQLREPAGSLAAGQALMAAGVLAAGEVFELVDGRLLEPTFVPIEADAVPRGRLWLYEDVTERLAAARVLAEQNAMLLEIDRMRAEWVGTVSHELRSPITAILGSAELLETAEEIASAVSPRTQDLIRVITRNAERLRRITDDLLMLADLERGRVALAYDWVDVPELCRHVVDGLAFHRRATNVTQDLGSGPPVLGDSARLGQLLENLLANALKFSGDGDVRLVAQPLDDAWMIEVADDGIGIPAGEAANLFERFARGSNAHGVPGSGLGLAIVRSIADLHDATVEIVSAEGNGTTVRVRVPIRADRPDPEET